MKNNVSLILFILAYFLIAPSVNATPKCTFTHYSSEDGLSQNTVMYMLQDRKGVLWMATWDGLNRFNGYNFKTYKASPNNQISLTNNRVDYIEEDLYGYIWVLTYDNRAHRFNPSTETFEKVPSLGESGDVNILSISVLPSGTVWLLTEGDGAVRVQTNPTTHELTTEHYSLKTGLSPTQKILKVYQDQARNEWLLTDNGLVMIKPGEPNPVTYFVENKENSPRVNQTFYSFQECGDEIFFGSDKGRLWRYQKNGGRFQLLELPTKQHIIAVDSISPTELLATTSTDGFYVYNLSTDKVEVYNHSTCKELPKYALMSTYVDWQCRIWFELNQPGGVCHFNPHTRKLKHEEMNTEPGSAARSEPAFHIHEDPYGRLWVHPFGGGLSYFDREANKLIPFFNEPGTPDWRFSNKIHSILSDRQGNLWVCTHSKGLEKATFISNNFSLEVPFPHDYESISNEVRALYQDDRRDIWVSVKEGSIRIYDGKHHFKGYLTESGTIAKTGKPLVGVAYCLKQDSKGIMWIATKGDGLVRAERVGDRFRLTRYKYDVEDIYSLSHNDVYSVYEDKNGRIWVATFGGGLNYIETTKEGQLIFINHRNNLKGYPIDRCYRVRYISSDNDGHIWAGTTTGALCFDEEFSNPEEIAFRHFSRMPSDPASLSNNDVHWVLTTRSGDVYLATFGGGLNKLQGINEQGKAAFRSYTVRDGAPSDVMLSIQEDALGNLWISTENGLSKFVPSQETFENYDESNFDLKVRFNEGASTILENGEFVFGTSNGMLIFTPDSVKKSTYVPDIIFSRLLIANVEVIPRQKNSVLQKGIDDIDNLKISHRENIFTLQYAAMDMRKPENIQYAYMLEGFDNDWSYVDRQRAATYTNLSKGEYVFRVKSTNSDGVWVNNERALKITVLPSFWETPFAYLLYLLGIMLVIFVAVYILFTIYRLKHEVSVEQQVSDIKLRFFTDISHELRTPLTLIAGPLEHILKRSDLPTEVRDQLGVVERNTDRMLRLVNQILDFRKIQNRKMKMRVQQVDVVPLVRQIMDNFVALAEENRIDFVFESESDNLKLWVDVDKLEKIVFNLLSNAFKYTAQGKMITAFIREDENTVTIGVQDQGIGIAENRKASLFVRFENLMDKNPFNHNSTGIGLSLVKELVELHKGEICVDSRLGEGSSFNVILHKGRNHYDESVEYILNDETDNLLSPFSKSTSSADKERVADEASFPAASPVDTASVGNSGSESISNAEGELQEAVKQRETMLLVEDNIELRFFLRTIFSSSFTIIEAADGLEGLEKARKFIPDIIISDVMMPNKDGLELTRELRVDLTTSHIPIVLLTAKNTIEDRLGGMEHGADDYITKPFSSTYLQARVENLLTQRRKLRDHYRDQLMNTPQVMTEQEAEPEETISTNDRRFMDKLVELMEKNMDNGNLVVDDLVKELAVSRSVFFKKLKMLTGLAPIEFIKEMRVKRAAQLIETGEFNMTQISYMVGINDPRYFSKCFKSKYGMTPTEYKEMKKGKK